ncbi:MAG TPA: alpha/beta hydrolase, partial [Streptosporangiaceae bacterium]
MRVQLAPVPGHQLLEGRRVAPASRNQQLRLRQRVHCPLRYFHNRLTWANALRRVQCPAFSLVRACSIRGRCLRRDRGFLSNLDAEGGLVPRGAVVSLPGPEASRRPRPRANSQATKDAARPVAMSPDRGRPGECRRERPRAMKITNSGGVDPDDYRPARRRPRRRSAVRRSVTVTRYLLGVLAAPHPVVIVAHSLGCIATSHISPEVAARVCGALLVAPADPERR